MRDIVQSVRDSPCRVRFGGEGRRVVPNVNLSKWGDRAYLNINRREGGGRTIREGPDELVLAGGDEAHRYRRLDEGRFEYDVILLERPRRPVLSLDLRFPEGLEFHRQRRLGPGERSSIAREPFVEGSYAVYWRERGGEFTTGKLCHIYRPQLVDSRGDRRWGELDVHGSTLDILLPEEWMKRARYPVTVDPIVGSSSVGASHLIDDGGELVPLRYELAMPVNRFQAQATLRGACTGYFYCYHYDGDAGGVPVVYADSGGAPGALLSSEGQFVDFDSSSGVWRSATFNLPSPIGAGAHFWFGAYPVNLFYPYFDDGGALEVMDVEAYSEPPGTFVTYKSESRILSMYFSYVASQAYGTTLTDGVGIADARVRRQVLRRGVVEIGSNGVAVCAARTSFVRRCSEVLGAADLVRRLSAYVRRCIDPPAPAADGMRRGSFVRGTRANAGVAGVARRSVHVAVRILEGLRLWDYLTNRTLATYEVVTLSSRVTVELSLDSRL